MALTRHEIASLNRVASIPEALASTDYATASTNSSQFVPDVEAVEAVEAIPHTFAGFSRRTECHAMASECGPCYCKRRDGFVGFTARHFQFRS